MKFGYVVLFSIFREPCNVVTERGLIIFFLGFCCYYNLYDKKHNCNEGWNKRYDGISAENWSLLQKIYNHPADIDLFTGGLAQNAYNGGLSGKVFLNMKSME